jgi:hypothetical protein
MWLIGTDTAASELDLRDSVRPTGDAVIAPEERRKVDGMTLATTGFAALHPWLQPLAPPGPMSGPSPHSLNVVIWGYARVGV